MPGQWDSSGSGPHTPCPPCDGTGPRTPGLRVTGKGRGRALALSLRFARAFSRRKSLGHVSLLGSGFQSSPRARPETNGLHSLCACSLASPERLNAGSRPGARTVARQRRTGLASCVRNRRDRQRPWTAAVPRTQRTPAPRCPTLSQAALVPAVGTRLPEQGQPPGGAAGQASRLSTGIPGGAGAQGLFYYDRDQS